MSDSESDFSYVDSDTNWSESEISEDDVDEESCDESDNGSIDEMSDNESHSKSEESEKSDEDDEAGMCDDDSETSSDVSDGMHNVNETFLRMSVDHVNKYYNKKPMRTSKLSGDAYMKELLNGHPGVCYEMFRMDVDVLRHLCNELKRLRILKEDKGIVSLEESVAMFLYIIGHNTRMRVVSDRFQHSTETVQRRFRRVLRAIHELGMILIKPDPGCNELPLSLHTNGKYYPWFKVHLFKVLHLYMQTTMF
jgi:hypothetical protein